MKKTTIVNIFTAITLLFNNWAYSQASIAQENVIEDIKVTTSYGKQKIYSVFRDAVKTNQWYYLPNELRIADETVNGKKRPKMTILRYQYQDIMTKENKSGGVLVASFTYSIEPEVVESVKSQIISRKKLLNTTINLASMPLTSSNIEFLSDSEDFIGKTDAKTSNGATSANQEMVISFNLTELGASIFKSLATSKSGIPIRANITYNGLTPPCGYKITGKWNDVYKYFEDSKMIEANLEVAGLPYVGGTLGTTISTNTVRERLVKNKILNIEAIACPTSADGSNTTDASMLEALKTIQNSVFNDEFLSKATELEKLSSQLKSSKDESFLDKLKSMATNTYGSIKANYQQSIKDVSKRQKGNINYDFSKQHNQIRQTTFGGLLSFDKYFPNGISEEALRKEGYLIDIDANDMPSIIVGLPNINPDYDLQSMVLEINYKKSDGKTISEARRWERDKGWVTVSNREIGYIRFNLLGEQNKQKRENPELNIKMQVISRIPNASFTIEKTTKLSTGEKYIDALEILTDQLIIDGSILDFKTLTQNPDDLAFAKIMLSKGKMTINKDLRTYFVNGSPTPPNMLYVLLPKDDQPFSSKITFTTNTGVKIERENQIVLGDNTLINDWKQ